LAAAIPERARTGFWSYLRGKEIDFVPSGALRWWLLGLLVAVFPANVHMAVNPEQVRGLVLNKIPRWALWARLPLQPLAMLWVWRATRD